MSDRVVITWADIEHAGGVEEAIIAFAAKNSNFVAGVIHDKTTKAEYSWYPPENWTSFAREALLSTPQAKYYVDCETGWIATLDADTDIDWSSGSRVELVCPDPQTTFQDYELLGSVFQEAVTTHAECSAVRDWLSLANTMFLRVGLLQAE